MKNLNKKTISDIAAVVLVTSSSLVAAGFTAEKMLHAGYICLNAGPADWTHCLKAEHIGDPAIPVKVFSVDGSEFLGTEQLMHEDVYVDRPCPQDGLFEWTPSNDLQGYFACHHFHTGHH
jgi:hypothetical protein